MSDMYYMYLKLSRDFMANLRRSFYTKGRKALISCGVTISDRK
jgi:hypothetical protein